MIFSVFKVRFTLQTGPSRDRLLNYRFVPKAVTQLSCQNCRSLIHLERLMSIERWKDWLELVALVAVIGSLIAAFKLRRFGR